MCQQQIKDRWKLVYLHKDKQYKNKRLYSRGKIQHNIIVQLLKVANWIKKNVQLSWIISRKYVQDMHVYVHKHNILFTQSGQIVQQQGCGNISEDLAK